MREGVKKGLTKAGLDLQREAQRRVPVDTGNLKASAFTRLLPYQEPEVIVGFTAAYAIYVHEMRMVNAGKPRTSGTGKGNYWDPQNRAQPKFLEEPFREMQDDILKTVQVEVIREVERG